MTEEELSEYLSTAQVAKKMGWTRRHAWKVMTSSAFRTFRTSSRMLMVRRSEFEQWLAELEDDNGSV